MANMTSAARLGSFNDPERLCRSDLQRVETELEAVATSQQVESREVNRLKEAIKSIHNDLSVIKHGTRHRITSQAAGLSRRYHQFYQ